ncbi:isochorismatase family protein [Trichomonas vaginalis G3]|uniref:nicotinamidase n=1 Tax=Trichomonas vaginalis (strain ATCC PRA-98 / G3) TaxID=412133 RepID=A2DHS6_TRIV3|nr:nicotinamide metabolic process [Trichomonas vaginalis G3]EAY20124.1 isochorismatase family protein [Trichomonas vaginalis G3]KAI5528076.1 nicotinamide metabolic process [Trichomonas vaginalis G3]|eukprot:XP_001581110.1 isochorismatase family protein [Trichomonas vaginalis G3]
MQDTALVVIDLQNDFVEPTGSLSVKGAMDIIPKVNRIRSKFQNVLFTYDWHPKNHVSFVDSHPGHKVYDIVDAGSVKQMLFPAHCVQNSKGAELQKDLIKKDGDMVVYKGTNEKIDSYSCFFDVIKSSQTNADQLLRSKGIKTLYILGVATDFCVKFSALDAVKLGYKVYLIEDCIAGVQKESSIAALKEMKEQGITFVNSNIF